MMAAAAGMAMPAGMVGMGAAAGGAHGTMPMMGVHVLGRGRGAWAAGGGEGGGRGGGHHGHRVGWSATASQVNNPPAAQYVAFQGRGRKLGT
jgi:hypothetical protein